MEELEQPRRCQATGIHSTQGPTTVHWDDSKWRINKGHRKCVGIIILARAVQSGSRVLVPPEKFEPRAPTPSTPA
eukprot:8471121-Prorocentrum_lima.AAC.1